jgi:hypothetical protein
MQRLLAKNAEKHGQHHQHHQPLHHQNGDEDHVVISSASEDSDDKEDNENALRALNRIATITASDDVCDACGNHFQVDSNFCRICGEPRLTNAGRMHNILQRYVSGDDAETTELKEELRLEIEDYAEMEEKIWTLKLELNDTLGAMQSRTKEAGEARRKEVVRRRANFENVPKNAPPQAATHADMMINVSIVSRGHSLSTRFVASNGEEINLELSLDATVRHLQLQFQKQTQIMAAIGVSDAHDEMLPEKTPLVSVGREQITILAKVLLDGHYVKSLRPIAAERDKGSTVKVLGGVTGRLIDKCRRVIWPDPDGRGEDVSSDPALLVYGVDYYIDPEEEELGMVRSNSRQQVRPTSPEEITAQLSMIQVLSAAIGIERPSSPYPGSQSTSQEQARWIVVDGLPDYEGEDIDIGEGISTVEAMKQKCEAHGDCVGFSHWPWGNWYFPKKKGTGFNPNNATYSQKRMGQNWQWYYLANRTEEVSVPPTPPTEFLRGPDVEEKAPKPRTPPRPDDVFR